MHSPVSQEAFDFLLTSDSCAVANAIELFDVRLRNEGFSQSSLCCRFPGMSPMVGYAATLRVRAGSPPPRGHAYFDRTDWWQSMSSFAVPHILVIEDIGSKPGVGAFVGEVHASILKALGCVGAVTNGSVRDLPGVERLGFHLFSGNVSVSHAYMHVVEVGTPVTIAGLEIRQGDLLHGDQHGIVNIPLAIADRIPSASARMRQREASITEFCRSKAFSPEGLRRLLQGDAAQG